MQFVVSSRCWRIWTSRAVIRAAETGSRSRVHRRQGRNLVRREDILRDLPRKAGMRRVMRQER